MSKIRELRKEKKLTMKKLGQYIGVAESTISLYENNKREPDNETLKKFADFFNVSTDYLLGRDTNVNYDRLKQEGFYNPKVKKIPVIGYVAAGLPIYADEHIIDYTYTEIENDGFDYFALKVEGDSMSAARINDGDMVIVRVQQTCEDGDIVVVRVDNENATIKKFHQIGDVVQLIPQSLNTKHEIQEYDLKTTKIDIVGKVVKCEIKF